MSPRLTTIYTKSGDSGSSALANGEKISKNHLRLEVIGTIDELNSLLGLALSYGLPAPLPKIIPQIQNELFELGADLATKKTTDANRIHEQHIQALENIVDNINAKLGPLQNFILPGGTTTASFLHLARTVCRRAERTAVALAQSEVLPLFTLPYLNRLSDALFMLARWVNFKNNQTETYWQPKDTD